MRDAMSHRGPDDAGLWAVGRRPRRARATGGCRSSICRAAGHQPMSNEDGTVWITFNGEIYNHAELRAEPRERAATCSARAPTPK